MADAHDAALAAGLPGVQATAASQLMRMHGLLKDTVTYEDGGKQHDEDIIAALANGDPVKEQQLRSIIGSDEHFAPLEVVEDVTPLVTPERDTG